MTQTDLTDPLATIDDWPDAAAATDAHVVTDTDRRFTLACATDSVRIRRDWRRLDDSTVRRRDIYEGYNYPDECWQTSQDHTRDYEIDADDCLVGDAPGWSGEGVNWKTHARRRHDTLLAKRLPRLEREVADR